MIVRRSCVDGARHTHAYARTHARTHARTRTPHRLRTHGVDRVRSCDSPFEMNFGATRLARFPSRCWLLHVCVETLQAPFELAVACGLILSPCCRIHTLPEPLFFSLVRRMIAMLINCVAEKTNAHSDIILSVAFSPDGTKIVSGSYDGTIKVWDSSAPRSPQNRPSLANTDACWLVWQASWRC